MEKSTKSGGIGFMGVLTCVFIALKLMGNITWSWFWVLSPTIIPIILSILILAIIGIVAIVEASK